MGAAGPINVLVNNAGVGLRNALEGVPMSMAREIFKTNTIGTMAMTRAVLPQFRERRLGVVINVSSSVTISRRMVSIAIASSVRGRNRPMTGRAVDRHGPRPTGPFRLSGGRYEVTGTHIEYWDDTGFIADGDFVDDVLHHAGMTLYRR